MKYEPSPAGDLRIVAEKARQCSSWTKGQNYEVYREMLTNWNKNCHMSTNEHYHKVIGKLQQNGDIEDLKFYTSEVITAWINEQKEFCIEKW